MRKVIINKEVIKDIDQFDRREKQWICSIVRYLKNEENSIETINLKFASLKDDFKGYYKAKHRGFKIRCVVKILSKCEIALYVEKSQSDPLIDEVMQLIAVGKRESIYEMARKRVKKETKD